jgi:hypothetical protein
MEIFRGMGVGLETPEERSFLRNSMGDKNKMRKRGTNQDSFTEGILP